MVVEDLMLECYIILHRYGVVIIPMLMKELLSSMEQVSFIQFLQWDRMCQQYQIIKLAE